MKNVGPRANILKASEKLRNSLEALCSKQHYSSAYVLFREDSESEGVFLVCTGKVRMSVQNLPKLSRDFGVGSHAEVPAQFGQVLYAHAHFSRAHQENALALTVLAEQYIRRRIVLLAA